MSKRKSGSLSERHNKRVRPAEDEDEEEDDGGISDDQNDPLLSQVWTCIFKQSFKAFEQVPHVEVIVVGETGPLTQPYQLYSSLDYLI